MFSGPGAKERDANGHAFWVYDEDINQTCTPYLYLSVIKFIFSIYMACWIGNNLGSSQESAKVYHDFPAAKIVAIPIYQKDDL